MENVGSVGKLLLRPEAKCGFYFHDTRTDMHYVEIPCTDQEIWKVRVHIH